MVRGGSGEVQQLRREVERAFSADLDTDRLLPLLARLARAAPHGSEDWLFAHRHLAHRGVERDPWRASLFARRVVMLNPADDVAWAVLGLAQSLLGHYRYAVSAYRRAIALAPDNPWYAHNLGHLLDRAIDRPEEALPLLAQATDAQPDEPEIATSYAHALARCGNLGLARKVLKRAARKGATADQMILSRWLDAGAPAAGLTETPRAEPKRKPRRRRSRGSEGAQGAADLSGQVPARGQRLGE
ncbi:tetratricopeptide repeat protein [Chondromyces apiculatus]|uniref:Uncharacterized protein n=1 Tax=Chondromyces apiculatus DSM 436 TaxID=1192034 RepID=A0A017SYF0_9BACT|nr:tetratricopeptide repeat protein [Chondromyces apiculatus]EYF01625.1 Hypothetical protein CAP_7944 [Chondromyces apiculatus DSM 436]